MSTQPEGPGRRRLRRTYGGPRSSRAEPSSKAEPSGLENLGLPFATSSPNPS